MILPGIAAGRRSSLDSMPDIRHLVGGVFRPSLVAGMSMVALGMVQLVLGPHSCGQFLVWPGLGH